MQSKTERKTARPKCHGGGQLPRLTIKNDWWVGTTGLCPVCNRNLKLTRNGSIPNHKKYR